MFYGWYIVAATAILNTLAGGLIFYGFTAMVDPIHLAFGWSYAQISLAMTLRGAEMTVLNPFTGLLADRWPARPLMLVGVVILGLGLFCLSQVNSLVMFYISFAILALGTSLALYMVSTAVVLRWFRRNVGKANGIVAIGIGAGGLFVPVVVKLLDTYDWRTSLLMITALVCIIGIPLSSVYRNKPEDYGLLPDGKPQNVITGAGGSNTYDFSVGVKEALKMRAFWYIGIVFGIQSAGVAAVILHVMPYLKSVGVDRSTASQVAMFIPIVSLPARFAFGWLCDIVRKKYAVAVSVGLSGVGLFLFSMIDRGSSGLIVAFLIVFGLGLGGMSPLIAPINRDYFGTKRIGTILGLTGILPSLGSIITPPLAGWVFDTRGFYDPTWSILGGVCVLGALLMLTMPSPRNREPAIA